VLHLAGAATLVSRGIKLLQRPPAGELRRTAAEVSGVELRTELMPPSVDEAKVRRLARLAARLDGASPSGTDPAAWENDLAEFNRKAGTALAIGDFQGIYGAEEHAE
jgi:hypothetical protein